MRQWKQSQIWRWRPTPRRIYSTHQFITPLKITQSSNCSGNETTGHIWYANAISLMAMDGHGTGLPVPTIFVPEVWLPKLEIPELSQRFLSQSQESQENQSQVPGFVCRDKNTVGFQSHCLCLIITDIT